MLPRWAIIFAARPVTVVEMTSTRIGPKKPPRVFLKEWRLSLGLSLERVGERFDPPIARAQVFKIEKAAGTGRIGSETVAAYAMAINRDHREMYSPPRSEDAPPSLDDVATELKIPYEQAVRALRIASGR